MAAVSSRSGAPPRREKFYYQPRHESRGVGTHSFFRPPSQRWVSSIELSYPEHSTAHPTSESSGEVKDSENFRRGRTASGSSDFNLAQFEQFQQRSFPILVFEIKESWGERKAAWSPLRAEPDGVCTWQHARVSDRRRDTKWPRTSRQSFLHSSESPSTRAADSKPRCSPHTGTSCPLFASGLRSEYSIPPRSTLAGSRCNRRSNAPATMAALSYARRHVAHGEGRGSLALGNVAGTGASNPSSLIRHFVLSISVPPRVSTRFVYWLQTYGYMPQAMLSVHAHGQCVPSVPLRCSL